jgi:hypothetical protein
MATVIRPPPPPRARCSYDTNFPGVMGQVFSNPSKGGIITEGGSRWYQHYPSDAGSVLTFVHWFNHLRPITPSPTAPFAFGMFLSWEVMVGGSNTRWHWATPDGSAEPVIPWDAHMFPDATPISYTEAAAVRNITTGEDSLLGFHNFLPDTWNFTQDTYAQLTPGATFAVALSQPASDYIIETTVWPNGAVGGGILFRGDAGTGTGYFAGFPNPADAHPAVTLEAWTPGGGRTVLGSFDMSTLDCGLQTGAWNMLRVVANGTRLSVWANPMFNESLTPAGIAGTPRITLTDATFPSGGGVSLVAVGPQGDGPAFFDYVGVLPLAAW